MDDEFCSLRYLEVRQDPGTYHTANGQENYCVVQIYQRYPEFLSYSPFLEVWNLYFPTVFEKTFRSDLHLLLFQDVKLHPMSLGCILLMRKNGLNVKLMGNYRNQYLDMGPYCVVNS